jgi:hypothetical protein
MPHDTRRHLARRAAEHAYLYAGAVKFQAESLLSADPPDMPEPFAHLRSAARQAQAMLLVLSLRNLLRAAEMASQHAEPPEKRNLDDALARFKTELPGLVDARDMLEHFDDYLSGTGRKARVYDVTFERSDSHYLIRIGSAEIDVARALAESRHLSGNAISAAGQDWGYPVGNEQTTTMPQRQSD